VPPSPESQSLTGLLISAGVFLIVAAVVVPGLVLRDTGVLAISREDLAQLTPTGKEELERRQGIARDAGKLAPYGGGFLFAAGALLIALGIPRLRRKEQSEDERKQIELDKLRREMRPQSEEEQEERLREDAREEVEEPAGQPPPVSAGRWLSEAAGAERAVLAQLAKIASPGYDLRSQVALEGMGRRLLLDALLISEVDQLPDIIVEIKYSRAGLANLGRRVQVAREQLLRYMEGYRRSSLGWLIVVVAERPSQEQRDALEHRIAESSDALRLSIVTPDDLDQLRLPI